MSPTVAHLFLATVGLHDGLAVPVAPATNAASAAVWAGSIGLGAYFAGPAVIDATSGGRGRGPSDYSPVFFQFTVTIGGIGSPI